MVGLLSLRVLLPMPTVLSPSQVIAQAPRCDDHEMIELHGKSIRLFALFPWKAAAGLRVCISAELCLATGVCPVAGLVGVSPVAPSFSDCAALLKVSVPRCVCRCLLENEQLT